VSAKRLLTVALAAVAFAAVLLPWKNFLMLDDCLDAGGALLDGICTKGPGEVIGFWRWHPGFVAILLVPPLLVALAVFAFARITFVREHVPPNKSLERTRAR
jgi:hypothetical protein